MVKIPVVNKKDNLIGYKEREEISSEDIYRVSALWITNSKGEVLISRRALTKKNGPGLWGPSVAGTVEENETYDSNIHKEAEEELGLKNIKLKKGLKKYFEGKRRFFCQMYYFTLDKEAKDFKIQKEEVDQVKWISKEELIKEISEHPEIFIQSYRNPDIIYELSPN